MGVTDSWLRDPVRIKSTLKEIAKDCIPFCVDVWLSAHVRNSVGEVDVSLKPKQAMGKDRRILIDELHNKLQSEQTRIGTVLDEQELKNRINQRWDELERSLNADDEWKIVFPGKMLLSIFKGKTRLDLGRFRTLYINAARNIQPNPFQEIREIFATWSS